jgi:hypothetical protein
MRSARCSHGSRGSVLVDTLVTTSALLAAVFVAALGLCRLGEQWASDFDRAEDALLTPTE